MRYLLFTLCLVSAQSAYACIIGEGPDDSKNYPDAPKMLCAVLNRAIMCQHFAGEDGYDAERTAFLAQQEKQLKCGRLRKDMSELRKTYAQDATISSIIRKTNAMYGLNY